MKWVFVKFFNVEVKVVLDRQPLLNTGPFPAWLCKLGHSHTMVALDTFNDNLCLWRCIAVLRGARPDRSTQAAREIETSCFKLRAAPNDVLTTSLDELDYIERHLNKELPLSDCLGSRCL